MELAAAYREAYEEAKESFSGQFGLFDEAQASADATVAAAQKALDSQLAFWQGYAENVSVLKGISAVDLGVTQANYDALMAYVRSGTPEAAGLAADMVKAVNEGNTQALTNLANTLGEIDENQSRAAQEVSAWTMGLTEQMDQLLLDIEEDIAALNMSDDAEANGRATVQAFIDGSADMLPLVQRTYASIAQSARRELATAAATSAGWNGSTFNIPGYASGTDNAQPGWAKVGENGPELMFFHGGEKVLNASQTAAVSAAQEYHGGGDNSYTFAPVYNVSGAADAGEVEAVIRRTTEDMHEQFLDWLEEERIEAKRRAY